MTKKTLFSFLLAVSLLQSCASKKDIIYLQGINNQKTNDINFYDGFIQPNDILKVTIESQVPEAALIYNRQSALKSVSANVDLLKLEGYLVSKDYTIKLPVLEDISVKNKTCKQLEETIKSKLELGNHLETPTVNVRLVNSKVTVLGEVNAPGTYNFNEASITLLQALGYAGDLTINGKRTDILLIREENGVRHINSLDLTSADLFNSKYYTIKQNDIIYVKPNGAKVKSAGYLNNIGTVLSVISILISTVIITTR